ncbi:MAG: IS630 family transposase [Emticicia sp.]|nr:IS630 family transposase [Emticicia sp.]
MEWGTRNKQLSLLHFDLLCWQKCFNHHQQEYIRRRLRAIRMYSEGKSRQQILQSLSISPKTLSGYLDLYISGGLEGLTVPIVKPRLQALNKVQQVKTKRDDFERISRNIFKKRSIWTLALLVSVLKDLYLITLTISTVWLYLRKMKLSHQKACHHYINEDKEEIRLYALNLIDHLVANDDAKIIFIDEFSICTRPSTHYMWGEQGKQPRVKSNEKNRTRTNGFVSVEAFSGEINVWQSSKAQSVQVAEFCLLQAKLAQKQGFSSLKIVLDNNKTHLKKMKNILKESLHESDLSIPVQFIHTATYAPKYNPAEYIIAVIRKKITHHLPCDFTIEQVYQRMEEVIQNETIQTKQQVWNTIDHILNEAILGNYSFKEL